MPHLDTAETRRAIIDACLDLGRKGINQGTSGNVSVRVGDDMLITPSAVPYADMTEDMIVRIPVAGPLPGPRFDGLRPSTEVPFHRALYAARPDIHAVVHAHPVHCTALAMTRQGIPACHYMVAAFGGHDVRLAGYARYGTEALSHEVLTAMEGRHGCLMANHGATTTADTLAKALWRMEELETLARGYILALGLGNPHILSRAEIDEVLAAFQGYGMKDV